MYDCCGVQLRCLQFSMKSAIAFNAVFWSGRASCIFLYDERSYSANFIIRSQFSGLAMLIIVSPPIFLYGQKV